MPKKKDDKEDALPEPGAITWFYVKHGAQQQTLFNADVGAATLIDAIREQCAVPATTGPIDLQDAETGALLALGKVPPRVDAVTVVKPTRVYILVEPVLGDGGLYAGELRLLYEPAEGEELPAAPPPPKPEGKKK